MTEIPSSPGPAPKLAPHHLRLFALILDYLLIITLLKLGDQALLGENWDLHPVTESTSGVSPAWAAGLTLLLLGKDALQGKSPGKWLGGIVVARADEPSRAASPRQSILRNLTLLLLPLEGVLVFLHPHCRRLGDRLAGTVVVTPPSGTPLGRRLIGMAVLFLAVLLLSFLLPPWNMRRSAAYQLAYAVAGQHPAVVEAVGSPVEVDSSPTFELSLSPEGGAATLAFETEGPRGTTEARVVLRLAAAPRVWKLEALTVGAQAPEPLIKQAPAR